MCLLFKEDFERGKIINKSTTFANEIINFCDNGTGHYKASFGHDDMVMTGVQLEFVKQTLQYKYIKETVGVSMSSDLFDPYADMTRSFTDNYNIRENERILR